MFKAKVMGERRSKMQKLLKKNTNLLNSGSNVRDCTHKDRHDAKDSEYRVVHESQ
jgi:hypothetical protein